MFYTYITTNTCNGTLYIGHARDVFARAREHRSQAFGSFGAQPRGGHLVWYEAHPTRGAALERERQIKNDSRAYALGLIEAQNPHWLDLSRSDIDIYVPEGEHLAAMLPELIQDHDLGLDLELVLEHQAFGQALGQALSQAL